MVPVEEKDRRNLAEKIGEQLAKGMTAGKTVCTYIDTTFSNPSLNRIKSIISDETDPERDSLIDLLLFPDESFQMALEPFLLNQTFSPADEEWIALQISLARCTAVIFFPWLRGHIDLALVPERTRILVRRLNICWFPDTSLRKTIDRRVDPARRMAVYVRLRNAGPSLDRDGLRLLCRFFNTCDDTQIDFFADFDFLAGWVVRMNGEDGYRQLMKERQRWSEAARYAVQFERMRQVSNMETLMLQGIQVPTVGIREAAAQIDTIDRLALILYGRIESTSPVWHTFDGSPSP
jgi:hypothetical protein